MSVYAVEYMVMKAKVDAYIAKQTVDGDDLDPELDGDEYGGES